MISNGNKLPSSMDGGNNQILANVAWTVCRDRCEARHALFSEEYSPVVDVHPDLTLKGDSTNS